MTFDDFLLFPNIYVFTGLFGFILMAYTLFYLLTIRPKSADVWCLSGFYGGLLLSYLCIFWLNVAPQHFGLLYPFQYAFVLWGAVGLAYFAYNFPRRDQPRGARWMVGAFAVIALGASAYSGWYAYQWFTAPRMPLLSPYYRLLVPVSTLVGLLVFWQRTVFYARQEPGWTWRRAFSVLWKRPQQPATLAQRDFTLALGIALFQGIFTVLETFPTLLPEARQYSTYGFNLALLLAVAGLALVYFNHAPHRITFMVKLVGATLVAILAISGMLVIEATAFMDRQHRATLDFAGAQARRAVVRRDWTALPAEVEYVISWPATASPDAADYRAEFGVARWQDDRAQYLLSQTSTEFTLDGRRYRVGVNLDSFHRQVQQIMLRLILLILVSSGGIILGFPVFFQLILVTPLNGLLAGVEQVRRGNLDIAIPIQYEDELGAATAAFNQMAHALRQAESERVQLTTRLAQEELFRSMFEAHSAVMLLINPDIGQIIQANQAAVSYYGYPMAELQAMSIYAINQLPPEEINQAMAHAKMAQRSDLEFPHCLASGEIRQVEVHSAPLKFKEQTLLFSIVHDITERKQAEQALDLSLQQQHALGALLRLGLQDAPLDQLLPAILTEILDLPWMPLQPQGGIFLVEGRPNTLVLKTHRNLPPALQKMCAQVAFGRCLCGRAAATRQVQFADCIDERHENHYDGIKDHGHYVIPILRGEKALGVIVLYLPAGHQQSTQEEQFLRAVADTVAGIVERKRAEEQTRQQAAQLETLRKVGLEIASRLDLEALLHSIGLQAIVLLEGSGGGLYLYRPERDVLEWAVGIGKPTPTIGTVIHRGEGLAGKVWDTGRPLVVDDYQHWEGRAAVYERYPFASVVEVPVYWGDEFLGVLGITGAPPRTFSPADAGLLSLFATQSAIAIRNARLYEQAQQEIAARARAEAELRKLTQAVEQSANTVVITDLEGRIEYANPKFVETTGYTLAEALGQNPRILKSGEHSDAYYRELWETITAGREWRGEFHNKRKDGSLYWEQTTITPVYDAAGRMTHFIAVQEDVTARKEAEERLRAALVHTETLRQAGAVVAATLEPDEALTRLLRDLQRVVPYDSASVQLLREGCLEIVGGDGWPNPQEIIGLRFPIPGDNPNTAVVQEGKAHILHDVAARYPAFRPGVHGHIQAWLGVPLVVRGRVTGLLAVYSSQPHYFTDEHLQLAQTFADQVAIALENARLYEQTRRDADTKAVLLREVNHRVKNNLATIIGLLYAEKRYARGEELDTFRAMMDELINRIQGLATAHNMLSASTWAPLSLSELATQVVAPSLRALSPDKRVEVEVSPSPLCVDARQAGSLALVFNELTTNVVKYALAGRATARITVQITGGGDTVQCEFRDDGPGYPEAVLRLEQHNVGLYLIQTIVRKDLQGELALRNDGGAVTLIKFNRPDRF